MFRFFSKQPLQYKKLHEKWSVKHKELQTTLWNNHKDALEWFLTKQKQAVVGSVAGLMLLASPGNLNATASSTTVQEAPMKDINKDIFFLTDLSNLLPANVRPLTPDEETKIAALLSEDFHLQVSSSLDNKRLNSTYGLIGAEQHLARYPGDTMDTHFDSASDAQLYYSSGMAPGLGAWGYFAPSQAQFTQQDSLREKYYIAAQTFLAPGYMENVKEYNDFFKYRKMLVVNPQNGKAVVAVIGDAGPSPWTGKTFGGSPEVMHYLDRVDGAQKGPVLVFFLNDPNDVVPLGPITVY